MEELSGGREIIKTILKLHGEQRRFTRIPIHAQAKILIDDSVVKGTVTEISLGGVFVELDEVIAPRIYVFITIIDDITSPIILEFLAKVISVTDIGLDCSLSRLLSLEIGNLIRESDNNKLDTPVFMGS